MRGIKAIGCTHIIEIKAHDIDKRSHGKISHTWKHLNYPTIVLPHLFSTWGTTLLLGSSRTFTKVVMGLRVMGEASKRYEWTNSKEFIEISMKIITACTLSTKLHTDSVLNLFFSHFFFVFLFWVLTPSAF